MTDHGAPKRVQMRRDRPWQSEPKALKVDRSTQWGNPFPVIAGDRARAVRMFEVHAVGVYPFTARHIREVLAGRDLACWCPTDTACHADVLLKIANTQSLEAPE
jgi:hypothetical protein